MWRFISISSFIVLCTAILLSLQPTQIPSPTQPSVSKERSAVSPAAPESPLLTPTPWLPAFPGAEGHGALARGGRGGRVIFVTNLNDSGPGSLREAVEAEGPRIVIFQVAGIIQLTDALIIKNPYLTIAGQTAPGGGITLKGGNDHIIRLSKGVHDVIIRYLRLRHGSGGPGENDNLNIRGGHDIIIDHLSLSWSTDENMGIWRDPNDEANYNITVQRTILAEGLSVQSNGIQISGVQDYSDPNNLVEAWRLNNDITLHHDLFMHNTHRNPRIIAGSTEVINNVTYNWKYRIGSTRGGTSIDYANNYFKGGPMSDLSHLLLHEVCANGHPDWICPLPEPSIYITGNIVMPNFPDPTTNNWEILQDFQTLAAIPLRFRRLTPLPQPPIPVTMQTAEAAYASILADVGANARLDCYGNWVVNGDVVDSRLLADLAHGTGPTNPINSPNDVGGYPIIDPSTPCPDRDRDGMPDGWEDANNLNANDPSDGPQDYNLNGYTNLEEYIHGIKQQNYRSYLPLTYR